jgi:hypothetical protein
MRRVGSANEMIIVEVRCLGQFLNHQVRHALDYEQTKRTWNVWQFMSQNACVSMPA